MIFTCGGCGTEFDTERDTRGSAERCPSCGAPAETDAPADTDDESAADGLACELCGRPLADMDAAADHLQDAHAVVTNAILENTAGIGGSA